VEKAKGNTEGNFLKKKEPMVEERQRSTSRTKAAVPKAVSSNFGVKKESGVRSSSR
jgi:hypothetical protein